MEMRHELLVTVDLLETGGAMVAAVVRSGFDAGYVVASVSGHNVDLNTASGIVGDGVTTWVRRIAAARRSSGR